MAKHPKAKRIVLILFDFMGYADIEPFGSGEIRTPNIRRLAERGRCHTDFYAPSPICVPSRAALLTGRYPKHLGMERNIYHGEPGLPPSEHSLAHHFKNAGYCTGLFGKWHLGYEPEDGPNAHGFDDFLGFHEWNIDYYSHKSREGDPALYRNTELVEIPGYTTDLFTDQAIDFVEKNADTPFFLFVSYNAGLPPYTPPGREDHPQSFDAWTDGSRADYAAMIEHLDTSVGRLLDSLGEDEETLVALTYDHGGADLACKGPFFHGFGTLWEGGIRVPLILNWLGRIEPGSTDGDPAIMMDLTATMLASAGVEAEKSLDGIDLLGEMPTEPRSLHWRIDFPTLHENWIARKQRAVRRGKWKYLWDGGMEFLIDLEADPGERVSLGYQHPELIAEMRELAAGDW